VYVNFSSVTSKHNWHTSETKNLFVFFSTVDYKLIMNFDKLQKDLNAEMTLFSANVISQKAPASARKYTTKTELRTRADVTHKIFQATRPDKVRVILKVMDNGPRSYKRADSDLSEAFIMLRLRHPLIAELVDYYVSDMFVTSLEIRPYTTTLNTFVEDRAWKLSHVEATAIMFQLLKALQFVHSNHVIHGDIKLSNIALQSLPTNDPIAQKLGMNYQLRLIDFGVSHIAAYPRAIYQRVTFNSISYRPPEVLLGMSATQAVDIWAAGIVLVNLFYDYASSDKMQNGSMERQDQLEIVNIFAGPFDYDYETTDARRLKIAKPKLPHVDMVSYFSAVPDDFAVLMQKLLIANPENRASAGVALLDLLFADLYDRDIFPEG
jgi:serine/threonine protein kinase